jgi:Effector-associated domain 10
MDNQDKIEAIIERIAEGKHSDADLSKLRELLSASDRESLIQFGKNIVGKIDGQDIQIGDRIYQGSDAEAIKEAFRLALQERKKNEGSFWQYPIFRLVIGGFVCILGGITLLAKQPKLCSLPASKTEADWVRYQDDIEPIEINYPRNWQKQEIKDAIRGQLVVLFPPQAELLYKANLKITFENISFSNLR